MLVDTSVWSLALRRQQENLNNQQLRLRRALEELIMEGRAQLLGVIRQELLSGIRHQQQFEKLRRTLRAFHDVVITTEDHEEAARIANRCRAEGVAGNPIDFFISAVAVRRKWEVFTLDEDFQRYRKCISLGIFKP
ncbi:type II toxin-antitoxin system VapC family toxin [Alloacidobacterium dinghuense]|uniref:type II toxin-antitoxin system VapC family toxin n=1 Tax=Alloacidobacterium dinghuense TaxID=2763107 RepID=UPI001C98DBDC|nr:PIN domain-containing protein [Alloacidobacterium dinghuense]